jgi:16S rRNA processing protein RimM
VDRLDVGRIARPHGLTGQVIVELWTNREERMEPGTRLHGQGRVLTVEQASRHHGRWIVTFVGVSGRSAADALRGVVLSAPPIDDPSVLWVHELIGSQLVDAAGRRHGEVVAVQANPASDLLVLDDGTLVPLRFVTRRERGVVVADLPEGLLG